MTAPLLRMPQDIQHLLNSVTTHDRWQNTPLWQLVSPHLQPRKPPAPLPYPDLDAAHRAQQEEKVAMVKLRQKLAVGVQDRCGGNRLPTRKFRAAVLDRIHRGPTLRWPRRSLGLHHPPASVLHPLLSLSGHVRVLSRRRSKLADPIATGGEMLYLLREHLPEAKPARLEAADALPLDSIVRTVAEINDELRY